MINSINWSPLFPVELLGVLAAISVLLVLLSLIKGGRGTFLRLFVLGLLFASLLNPQLTHEQQEPLSDIALIVIDKSSSQSVTGREEETSLARLDVLEKMKAYENLEIREIEVNDNPDDALSGTSLWSSMTAAIADIPEKQFAGTLLITDGQVHDVPADLGNNVVRPVHSLLTGEAGEIDRRLVIEKVPGYGIVNSTIELTFRVEDHREGKPSISKILVTLYHGGEVIDEMSVAPGGTGTFRVNIEHAGNQFYEVVAGGIPDEMSLENNRALIKVNGVRDRLRVLLVSGQAHTGERVWRNLLKSDPSVDLVHFTILRPPSKIDFTPLQELALISFPVQELFEEKLDDFDLIVFDRYLIRDLMPPSYMRNIVHYVKNGGAVLLAVGPEFVGSNSLYNTALGEILPVAPLGPVLEQPYVPTVSKTGLSHPVTAPLTGKSATDPQWGKWFRLIDAGLSSGDVLMSGPDEKPLLVLGRQDKGRVATLLSDHIWLWARGYDGGGPQAELLRRLSHWLMKEPELEEENLAATINNATLLITRQTLKEELPEVRVTSPDGKSEIVKMDFVSPGIGQAKMPVTQTGLYRINDGETTVLAASGALNPLELSDLRSTGALLKPVSTATGGGLFRMSDGMPTVRRVRVDRDRSGKNWIGLIENNAFAVSGYQQQPVIPPLVLLGLALMGLIGAWWREGH